MKTAFGGGGVPTGGDLWVVARVAWDATQPDPCAIEPVGSHPATFKPDKDGSPNVCVDTGPRNQGSAPGGWPFTSSTASPPPSDAYCWH
jgi:hypothetical protein